MNRNGEDEKFKSIVLKQEPARHHSPDLITTHTIKPTNSPTNQSGHRPSTPIHHYHHPPEPEISHSQIHTRPSH